MKYSVTTMAADLQDIRDNIRNSITRTGVSPVEDSPVRDREFSPGAYRIIAADCMKRRVDLAAHADDCELQSLADVITAAEKTLKESADDMTSTEITETRAAEILAAMPWKPRFSLYGSPLFTAPEARALWYALQAWAGMGRLPKNYFFVGGEAIPCE